MGVSDDGTPQLRYYVAQAFLRIRVFMTLNGEREPRTGRWTRVGNEGTATFLHLLGRGVIAPPRRDQLRAISPVALVVKNPSERFAQHGANGHQEASWNNDGTDRQPWAFDRLDCYWGMAPLPPTDVATYLWGRTRRDPSQLATTTSHGFVALVPGETSRAPMALGRRSGPPTATASCATESLSHSATRAPRSWRTSRPAQKRSRSL